MTQTIAAASFSGIIFYIHSNLEKYLYNNYWKNIKEMYYTIEELHGWKLQKFSFFTKKRHSENSDEKMLFGNFTFKTVSSECFFTEITLRCWFAIYSSALKFFFSKIFRSGPAYSQKTNFPAIQKFSKTSFYVIENLHLRLKGQPGC